MCAKSDRCRLFPSWPSPDMDRRRRWERMVNDRARLQASNSKRLLLLYDHKPRYLLYSRKLVHDAEVKADSWVFTIASIAAERGDIGGVQSVNHMFAELLLNRRLVFFCKKLFYTWMTISRGIVIGTNTQREK